MILNGSEGTRKARLVNHQGKLVTFLEQSNNDEPVLRFSVTDPVSQDGPTDILEVTYPDEIRIAGLSLVTLPDNSLPDDLTALGQWEVLSDSSYIYLFRSLPASGSWVLVANRYILVPVPGEKVGDPVSYRLVPKTEARYQESRLRETPASATDKPGYRDLDGAFFHEPVIIIPGVMPHGGHFGVALLPTDQPPTLRWIIFYAGMQKGEGKTPDRNLIWYFSAPRDAYGWIDYGLGGKKSGRIVEGAFTLSHCDSGDQLALVGPVSIKLFRRQEQTPGKGPDSLTGPRLMLAGRYTVGTGEGGAAPRQRLACIDFALAPDGAPEIDVPNLGDIALGEVDKALTALEFDGDRDWVAITSDLPTTHENFTFEAWVRNDGRSGAICTRMADKDSEVAGFTFVFDGDKVCATYRFYDPEDKEAGPAMDHVLSVAAPAPSQHQWHHLAATLKFIERTKTATKYRLRLYQDGIETAVHDGEVESINPVEPHARGETFLGHDASEAAQPGLTGAIDEVRLWHAARDTAGIEKFLYRELSEDEIEKEEKLIGYWKFDDAFSDQPWIALDSKGNNCGRVHGASWITGTAPVTRSAGPVVLPSLNGFSSDMGILAFLEDQVLDDPQLEDGADGLIHLYFSGDDTADSTNLNLQALHYDTTVSRARYALPWSAKDDPNETGTVVLAARSPGPALNLGPPQGQVVTVTANKESHHLLDLTIATDESIGVTESFTALPSLAKSFSQVLNGEASNDPDDLKVRTGEVPYYDYSGTRPAVELATKTGAPLQLVSRRNPLAVSALHIANAEVDNAKNPGQLDLSIEFAPVISTLKDRKGNSVEVNRKFKPKLNFKGVPVESQALFAVLDGAQADGLTITGVKMAALTAGGGNLYIVHSSSAEISVSVEMLGPDLCNATVQRVDNGKHLSAKWKKVPRDPAGFMRALNLQDDHEADEAQIDLAADFVLIGANLSTAVSGESSPVAKPDGIAPFLSVIGIGVAGIVTSSGKVNTAPRQCYTITNPPKGATGSGSRLFAVTPFVPPASGREAMIVPSNGQLVGAGNFGGWVPTPRTTSGDFSKAPAGLELSTTEALALDLPGDFTFEAWVRPEELSKPQRIFTASTPSGASYTAGLTKQPTYAVELKEDIVATADLSDADTLGESKVVTVTFWLNGGEVVQKDGNPWNNASISLFFKAEEDESDKQEWFVLGRSRHSNDKNDDKYIWSGIFNDTDRTAMPLVNDPGTSLKDGWVFVALQLDLENNKASLRWRGIEEKEFHSGTFDKDTRFTDNAVMTEFGIGKPSKTKGATTGRKQYQAEIALWKRKLDDDDLEALFLAPPEIDASDLVLRYDIESKGGSVSSIDDSAMSGPRPPLKFFKPSNASVSDDTLTTASVCVTGGPRPIPVLFTGAGPRVVKTSVPLKTKTWSHVAMACSDNDALQFDGTQVAVARESAGMSFDQNLGIDIRLQFELDPENDGRRVLVAKSDNTETDASYVLGCDHKGRVFARVWLDNGASYEFVPRNSVKLPQGKPVYLAFTANIMEDVPDEFDFEFSYTAKDGTGRAESNSKFKTRLVLTIFIETNEGEPIRETSSFELHEGTQSKSYQLGRSTAPLTVGARAAEQSPAAPFAGRANFRGLAGGVRLWSADIRPHIVALSRIEGVPADLSDGLEANWPMDEGEGKVAADSVAGHDLELPTSYMWTKARITSDFALYFNGQPVESKLVPPLSLTGGYGKCDNFTLGAVTLENGPAQLFKGQMDDVRLWSVARSEDEIVNNLYTEMSGDKSGLAGYWPVDIGSGTLIKDATGRGNGLELADSSCVTDFWWLAQGKDESPIGNEAPDFRNALQGPKTALQVHNARSSASAAEYSALYTDSEGITRGVQYRGYVYLAPWPEDSNKTAVAFIPRFKVGDADLTYIGQAQSDPTILGYIEGAPPVPRENLTRPYYTNPAAYQRYTGVSLARLSESNEVIYTYAAGRDSGFDLNAAFSVGHAFSAKTKLVIAPGGGGINVQGPSFQGKAGISASFGYSTGFLDSASRTIGTSRGREVEISVGGNWAPPPENNTEERFYKPDNIGAALVKSGVANVYALRLKRTGALSGIMMAPDPDMEPDFNIILFPINSNYTKQGTLDGMQGFATDPDYPEANLRRSSYFKPREANDLEQQIKVFESSLAGDYAALKAGELGREPLSNASKLLEEELNATVEFAERQSRRNLVNTEVWTAGGGLFSEMMKALETRTETHGGSYSFSGLGGVSGDLQATIMGIGVYFDASLLLGGHLQSHVSKSDTESLDFALSASNDTEAFLAKWLPRKNEPENGGAAEPGKVSGFRYKSFYVAPSAHAFDDFFNEVIDPNWLLTSSENAAQALRQARGARSNAWRVLHRVTYVERVPPSFNNTAQDTAERPSRSLVDLAQNALFLELVEENMPTVGNLPERVSCAVTKILAENGPLSSRLPWWNAFVDNVTENMIGDAADAFHVVMEASRSYALAYIEQRRT